MTKTAIRLGVDITSGRPTTSTSDKYELPLLNIVVNSDLDISLECLDYLPEYESLWRRYVIWCINQHDLNLDSGTRFVLGHMVQHHKGIITDDKLKSVIGPMNMGNGEELVLRVRAFIKGKCTIQSAINSIVNIVVENYIFKSNLRSKDGKAISDSIKAIYKAKLIQIVTFGEWVD